MPGEAFFSALLIPTRGIYILCPYQPPAPSPVLKDTPSHTCKEVVHKPGDVRALGVARQEPRSLRYLIRMSPSVCENVWAGSAVLVSVGV